MWWGWAIPAGWLESDKEMRLLEVSMMLGYKWKGGGQ